MKLQQPMEQRMAPPGTDPAQLAAEARLHQVAMDAVALMPHMLAAFIARDRGFKAMVRR